MDHPSFLKTAFGHRRAGEFLRAYPAHRDVCSFAPLGSGRGPDVCVLCEYCITIRPEPTGRFCGLALPNTGRAFGPVRETSISSLDDCIFAFHANIVPQSLGVPGRFAVQRKLNAGRCLTGKRNSLMFAVSANIIPQNPRKRGEFSNFF